MTSEIDACLIAAAVAAIVTWIGAFGFERLSVRVGAMVPPDERRVHTRPLPILGGAAMFVAFLAAMGVAWLLPGFRAVFQGSSESLGVVIAAAVVFAVGQLDDLLDMTQPAKLAGLVLGAMALYFLGVTMYEVKIPFVDVVVLSPSWTPLITALWVCALANAVNFIDGLDGLAAGIIAIAGGALCVYGLWLVSQGNLDASNLGPMVAAIAAGCCIGFLPHNFHPARIIMGDAGALFLGLLMAAATMVVGGRTSDVTGNAYFFFAPLFVPLFILGVPIVDMAFAVVRRTANRHGFANADKDHLHHRLLRLGHGQRRAVAILWMWTALLSAFFLYPIVNPHGNAVVPFLGGALVVVLYTWFLPGWGREGARSDDEVDREAAEAAADLPGPAGRARSGDRPAAGDRVAEGDHVEEGRRVRAGKRVTAGTSGAENRVRVR